MVREVFLLVTAQGYIAHQGTRCYTENPEQAISFVDHDVAIEKAREFSRFSGIACQPCLHLQQFPRPFSPTSHSHGTKERKVPTKHPA